MKKNKHKVVYSGSVIVVLAILAWFGQQAIFSANAADEFAKPGSARQVAAKEAVAVSSAPAGPIVVKPNKPKYVRGIHLTAWVSGSSKLRAKYDELFNTTELNTAVIDIKEHEGEIYIPGFAQAEKYKTYVPAIPDIQKYLANLKSRNIYTVARIVVFKDNRLPRIKPEWAVKDAEGKVWQDRKGLAWADPYRKEVWDYNLALAERAADLGFEEIQFDYIRFPSDGNIKACRYSQVHTSTNAANALVDFLKEANRRLKPRGLNLSIDVFGLTTTVSHDMGIGQKIVEMTHWVDFVSPMVYPSHYAKGEYRIPDPNKAPYKTVYLGIAGAKKRLGNDAIAKLRPYLQDFSQGVHYGPAEVRAQIQACYDNDVAEWLLWNAACRYTRGALKDKSETDRYEKKELPESVRPAEPKTKPVEGTKAEPKKTGQTPASAQ